MHADFKIKIEMNTLAGYKWTVNDPKALICLIHGVGEHAGRYDHVAMRFCTRGFSVYAVDLAGHGRSDGKRGDAGSTEKIIKILDELIIYAKNDCKNTPVIVMGHSMGGNIVLSYRYYRRDLDSVLGYVVSAPWLRINNKITTGFYAPLELLSRFMPRLSIDTGVAGAKLSTNPTMAPTDALCHGKITLKTAVDRERDARLVLANAKLGKPVFLFNGDADATCLPEGAHEFHEAAGDICTYREWKGLNHETLNEDVWEQVTDSAIDWVEKLLKTL